MLITAYVFARERSAAVNPLAVVVVVVAVLAALDVAALRWGVDSRHFTANWSWW